MPWAGLNKELKLGPITFWPFSAARTYVTDETLREQLERYFRCYIDHRGQPVKSVTIASHEAVDFRELGQQESSETRAAVDALLFSTICPTTKAAVCGNNNTMGPPSAERYEMLAQNFNLGDDHVAVRAGSVLSGGWKIGEISFPMPWSLGGSFGTPDSELVTGFSKIFDSTFPLDVKERLLRSLEWFRFAHVESDEISILSKVVMMATAFEIILDVAAEATDKSGWIAKEVAKRCSSQKSLVETRKDKKGNDQTRAKISWWAWDFYKLRNAIVHGDAVQSEQLQFQAPERNWLTELIVADLVFWELVTRELYETGTIGQNVRDCEAEWDKAFPEEPAGASEKQLARWLLGFDDVHRALGWVPERSKDGDRVE
jgi:Apea-like HEPN